MASAKLARPTAEGPASAADELQAMFPALEREVIESALRQHCGAMEATVDYLVALTQGDTARLMQPTPSDHLGGPARYMEAATQLDTPPQVGRGNHRAAWNGSFGGQTGKPGSKYARRLVGPQKAAVSSDGLDLHFEQQEENDDGALYDHSDGRTSKPASVAARLARQLSLSKKQGTTSAPATSVRHQLLSAGSDEDELGPTQGYHKLEGANAS